MLLSPSSNGFFPTSLELGLNVADFLLLIREKLHKYSTNLFFSLIASIAILIVLALLPIFYFGLLYFFTKVDRKLKKVIKTIPYMSLDELTSLISATENLNSTHSLENIKTSFKSGNFITRALRKSISSMLISIDKLLTHAKLQLITDKQYFTTDWLEHPTKGVSVLEVDNSDW